MYVECSFCAVRSVTETSEMRRVLSSDPSAVLSDNTNNRTTVTAATSVGSLLAEEILINPTSFLPSFLELKYIEVASDLGRSSLKRFLSAVIRHTATLRSTSSSFSLVTKILQFFHPYTSELSVLITYVVERRILNVYGATLMEYFMYGLKRSRVTPQGKISDITNKDKIRCALMVSLIPYFKEKLTALYHQEIPSSLITEHDKHHQLFSIWKRKIQLMHIKIYPFLHFALEGTLLAYQWAYLFGRSLYYSPDLHFLHIVPRRLTLEDVQSKQENISLSTPQNNSSSMATWTPSSAKVASFILCSRLVFRIATLMRRSRQRQTIETVLSDSVKSTTADPLAYTSLVYPAPEPPSSTLCSQRLQLVVSPGLCPLCSHIPVNPSASPSGYVYCFKCLVIYVRDHDGLCPHGGICSEDQIVRLNS